METKPGRVIENPVEDGLDDECIGGCEIEFDGGFEVDVSVGYLSGIAKEFREDEHLKLSVFAESLIVNPRGNFPKYAINESLKRRIVIKGDLQSPLTFENYLQSHLT